MLLELDINLFLQQLMQQLIHLSDHIFFFNSLGNKTITKPIAVEYQRQDTDNYGIKFGGDS